MGGENGGGQCVGSFEHHQDLPAPHGHQGQGEGDFHLQQGRGEHLPRAYRALRHQAHDRGRGKGDQTRIVWDWCECWGGEAWGGQYSWLPTCYRFSREQVSNELPWLLGASRYSHVSPARGCGQGGGGHGG